MSPSQTVGIAAVIVALFSGVFMYGYSTGLEHGRKTGHAAGYRQAIVDEEGGE